VTPDDVLDPGDDEPVAEPAAGSGERGQAARWRLAVGDEENEAVVVRALEGYLPVEPADIAMTDIAAASGISVERLEAFWRAFGFPQSPRDSSELTASDAELLSTFVAFFLERGNERGIGLQLARVIGTSLDRVASAQIDALVAGVLLRSFEDEGEPVRTLEFSGMMPRLLELVWRRHLANAARRRLLRPTVGDSAKVCVGFADMVGFTAQAQRLDQIALARIIGRFEATAYEVVTRHGGRVVKTIGDEVMFLTEDARSGADAAVDLARTFHADPDLPNLRVGLAAGPVLQRRGDVYGATVNLASRIVGVAFPGTVLVSESVHDDLVDDPEVAFASTETFYLKDMGDTTVWRLVGDPDNRGAAGRALEAAKDDWRRGLSAEWRDRSDQLSGDVRRQLSTAKAGGDPPELIKLPERLADVLGDEFEPERVDHFALGMSDREIENLAAAILATDIDPALQLDLLTDLDALPALRRISDAADRRIAEADERATQRLRAVEDETARIVSETERHARETVATAFEHAGVEVRAVSEDVDRTVGEILDDVRREGTEARREARERAARRIEDRRRRGDA